MTHPLVHRTGAIPDIDDDSEEEGEAKATSSPPTHEADTPQEPPQLPEESSMAEEKQEDEPVSESKGELQDPRPARTSTEEELRPRLPIVANWEIAELSSFPRFPLLPPPPSDRRFSYLSILIQRVGLKDYESYYLPFISVVICGGLSRFYT